MAVPTLSSWTLAADGRSLTTVWSEAVNYAAAAKCWLNTPATGGVATVSPKRVHNDQATPTGNGTDTLVFNLIGYGLSSETLTFGAVAGLVVSVSTAEASAAHTTTAGTNSSTATLAAGTLTRIPADPIALWAIPDAYPIDIEEAGSPTFKVAIKAMDEWEGIASVTFTFYDAASGGSLVNVTRTGSTTDSDHTVTSSSFGALTGRTYESEYWWLEIDVDWTKGTSIYVEASITGTNGTVSNMASRLGRRRLYRAKAAANRNVIFVDGTGGTDQNLTGTDIQSGGNEAKALQTISRAWEEAYDNRASTPVDEIQILTAGTYATATSGSYKKPSIFRTSGELCLHRPKPGLGLDSDDIEIRNGDSTGVTFESFMAFENITFTLTGNAAGLGGLVWRLGRSASPDNGKYIAFRRCEFEYFTNEIQRLQFTGSPTGSFALTFDGQTTGAITLATSASAIQTALEALSNVAPGDVAVYGSGNLYYIEFTGTYAGTNVATMTVDNTGVSGGTGGITTPQYGYLAWDDEATFTSVEDCQTRNADRAGAIAESASTTLASDIIVSNHVTTNSGTPWRVSANRVLVEGSHASGGGKSGVWPAGTHFQNIAITRQGSAAAPFATDILLWDCKVWDYGPEEVNLCQIAGEFERIGIVDCGCHPNAIAQQLLRVTEGAGSAGDAQYTDVRNLQIVHCTIGTSYTNLAVGISFANRPLSKVLVRNTVTQHLDYLAGLDFDNIAGLTIEGLATDSGDYGSSNFDPTDWGALQTGSGNIAAVYGIDGIATGDFTIASDSTLVDAGVPSGVRYSASGVAWDATTPHIGMEAVVVGGPVPVLSHYYERAAL